MLRRVMVCLSRIVPAHFQLSLKHSVIPIVVGLFCLQNVWGAAQSYSIALTSTMTKVSPVAKDFRGGIENAQITMAKNEHEGIQLVILSPLKSLKSIKITYGDFKQDNGSGRIEAENISWRLVKYIHGASPFKESIDYNKPANWPDPLIEAENGEFGDFNVEAGEAQSIWLDIYTPTDTPAGTYQGKIYIEPLAQLVTVVPISVRVWDFALTKETHLRSFFFIWDKSLAINHKVTLGDQRFLEIRRKYVKAYLNHRVSPTAPSYYQGMLKYVLKEDGTTTIDWSEFDREMQSCIENGLNTIAWPGNCLLQPKRLQIYNGGPYMWDVKGQRYTIANFVDEDWISVMSSDEVQRLTEEQRKIALHLKEKGWLDKCVAYLVGEPTEGHYNHTKIMDDFEYARRIFKWMHEVEPNIANMAAVLQTPSIFSDKIDADIDIWAIDSTTLSNKPEEMQAAVQAKGKQVWTYFPGLYHISLQTGAWRVGPWYCWKYKLNGFGPYTDITAWIGGDPWANKDGGDGIIYPGKDGPVETVRFELLRDGMEDYEYFWTLDKLTNRLEQVDKNSPLIISARRLLSSDDRVIKGRKVWDAPSNWFTDQWNFNGATIQQVRNEVGTLCDQIQTKLFKLEQKIK